MIKLRDQVPLLRFWPARRRLRLKFIYTDDYWMIDLGRHVFPVKKYRMIYLALLQMGIRKESFIQPRAADDEDLLLVHDRKYLKKLRSNKLSGQDLLALELPFSAEILDFALTSVGGTIQAARIALKEGLSVHIGGGFHHAFADHGEGFCVLNDVAVALERLRNDGQIERGMVVDGDVHQGNGTAAIFEDSPYAFTFSIHQMDIYPAQKSFSTVDVELWAGDGDEKYLDELRAYFPRLYQSFRPDIVFYLAGADPYEKDQLGGLALSMDGLRERDRIVIEEARKLRIPLVITLAGGYAFDVSDTVSIHLNTIRTALRVHRRAGRGAPPP